MKLRFKKKCLGSCESYKPMDDFSKQADGKGGRTTICRECRSATRRAYNYVRPSEGTIVHCPKCEEELDQSKFNADKSSQNGLQTYCRECKVGIAKIYESTFKGFLTILFKDLKGNAKKRGIPVDITKDDVISLYHKQEGKCRLTKIPMTHTKVDATYYNISVDRIDSSVGYTKKNIQIICNAANKMKGDLKIREFLDLADKVTSHQAKLKN